MKSPSEKAVALVRRTGVVRARELTREGVTGEHLRRLLQRGQLQRIGVGLYSLPGGDISEHRSLAEACSRVPRGVICLLSALRFHNLTTQNPFEVWMAIPHKAWRPKGGGVRLRPNASFRSRSDQRGWRSIALKVCRFGSSIRRRLWPIVSNSETRSDSTWHWKPYATIDENTDQAWMNSGASPRCVG